jgi:hypothetical protein
MFDVMNYETDFHPDSKNVRVSNLCKFNGQTLVISGFENSVAIPGPINGTCFRLASIPAIDDGILPIQNSSVQKPISVDLVYRFTEQDVVLMESNGIELDFAAYTLGYQGGSHVNISSTSIIVNCQPRVNPEIERSEFEVLDSYKMVNNTFNEKDDYPLEVTYSEFRVKTNTREVANEWPIMNRLSELSELIYKGCSHSVPVYNDSKSPINKNGAYTGILIKIKLKDNIKEIIDSHFTVTEDTLFRIIINPIFTTHTSISGKARVLYPIRTTPVDDLNFIVFTSVKSVLPSPTHYRITLEYENQLLVDGSSTGEYRCNPILNISENINPFRFFYGKTDSLTPLQKGQIRYDGTHDGMIGVPSTSHESIVVEVNESVAFKLRDYSLITVTIYATDGTRNKITNLWSI